MDKGPETIADEMERAQLRHQARRVHLQAFAFAALATIGLALLP